VSTKHHSLASNAAWRALGDDEPEGSLDAGDAPAERAGGRRARCEELLERAGFFEREQVAAAMGRARPLTPKETQRAAIRLMRRGGCGRRGLPAAVVTAMYMDYLRLGSLAKVGRLYDRTRQAIYDVFRRAGLQLNDRNFHARILFGGEYWTPGKGGYYRPTVRDRTRRLHVEMWKATSGRAVPSGWQVTFRNGDNSDIRPGNLVCLPIEEVTRLHYRRHFPQRAGMSAEQRAEFWKSYYLARYHEAAAKFRKRGLRCDGKPLTRKGPVPADRLESDHHDYGR
jgi:hypothetical protein